MCVIRHFPPLRAILIGFAYLIAAAASVRYTRFDGGVALIWVASALLIVELSLQPPSTWRPTLFLSAMASFAATSIFGLGPAPAIGIAVAMVGEAAGAAWLLRRLRGGRLDLGSMEGFIVFAGVAGLLAPALGGIAGAATVTYATRGDFWLNWFHWYVAHALGNIILAPILVLVLSGEFHRQLGRLRARRRWEALGLSIALTLVTGAVFVQTALPILFLPLLPTMIAAFRFGRVGSALSIVILAIVGGSLTLAGRGPVELIQATSGMKALFFQFYLVTAAFIALPVAAVLQKSATLFRALRESEARYRLIAEGSSDVILNLDRAGRIRYVSPSVTELSGYDPADLIGKGAGPLVFSEDRPDTAETHRRAMADPGTTIILEYRGLTADGTTVWCETHTRGVTDDDGSVIGSVSQIRDITHHKAVEAELAHAAKTDTLTGIGNRRAFDEMLDQRIEDVRAGRGEGCCAILDLDFFKLVNDRHGHDAGDRVLRTFADVASASIRDEDTIARLGGEEFGLILWGADLAEAHKVCERLRREIEDLSISTRAGPAISVTFSGGIARIAGDLPRDEILREADAALYRAKHAGRNRLVAAG